MHFVLQTNRKTEPVLSQKDTITLAVIMLLIIVLGVLGIVAVFGAKSPGIVLEPVAETTYIAETEDETEEETEPTEDPMAVFYPEPAADMVVIPEENLVAQHAVLIDVDNNQMLAVKGNADDEIYPASMTKLMTLIVAIENVEDVDSTFTITGDLLQPLWAQSASMAGFADGETVTFTDLLYGAALPSGADATQGLAMMVAGSDEAFVQMMNDKAAELGLKHTHFVNTSGLHDENHYSTPEDIALIMEYCLKNELCKEVISTYKYTTSKTEQNPNGIELTSTMFNKMYGNEVPGITIGGGKTGYTDEAGQCLASYAETPDGHLYVAVTSKGAGKFTTVFDAFKLYGIVTGTYAMDQSDPAAEYRQ